jgi:TonB family protein
MTRNREESLRLRLSLEGEHEPEERLRPIGVSVLLHIAVIALILWLQSSGIFEKPGMGPGTMIGSGGGGGGGGQEGDVPYIDLAAWSPPPPPEPPQPAPVVPEVPPVVIPEVPEPVVQPPVIAMTPPVVTVDTTNPGAANSTGAVSSGTGPGSGGGSGTGAGPGSGSGTGPGSGSGSGGGFGNGGGGVRGFPPSPRMLLLPPTAPRSVRGQSVKLELDVDTAGVVRDVRIQPPTGDGKFDDSLRKTAFGWRFRPARDLDGRPIATIFEVVFTF